MKKKRFLLCLIFITSLNASSSNNVYKINEFQIFYTLTGKDKLPLKNQIDENNNAIPDYVESIGNQLNKASVLFKELGFMISQRIL